MEPEEPDEKEPAPEKEKEGGKEKEKEKEGGKEKDKGANPMSDGVEEEEYEDLVAEAPIWKQFGSRWAFNPVNEAQDKFIMKGFTSRDIDNLDVAADDVSDILSNRVPWNKWVKMNNDNKARNVEHALQNLTKSNAVKNLIGKKKEAVISYIVHSLSESIN